MSKHDLSLSRRIWNAITRTPYIQCTAQYPCSGSNILQCQKQDRHRGKHETWNGWEWVDSDWPQTDRSSFRRRR